VHGVRRIALQYHDVIEGDDFDVSGFSGPEAATYKIDLGTFRAHLQAIQALGTAPPRSVMDPVDQAPGPGPLLTFDDGGRSASRPIADLLDELGWIGHFFITTSRIDTAGFADRMDIMDLYRRGHVIGTHSVSHPVRMAACTDTELATEWRDSVDSLSNILGTEIVTASLPGGYYDRRVAQAASAAGLQILFTSEPTIRCQIVDACQVIGRFTLRRNSSAPYAASLAAGRLGPRLRQYAVWNLKKMAKCLGGAGYLQARKWLLR